MTHILILAAALQASPAAAPEAVPEMGAVEGKVLDAVTGAAIRKATVTLMMRGTRTEPTPQGVVYLSDGDGAFRGSLPPGIYTLAAERNGFTGTRNAALTITVKANETVKDVTIKMTAHGVIAGRVLDEDGEPMARVLVQCLKWMAVPPMGRRLTPRATAQTNDLGEYRLYGLDPGKCLIAAQLMASMPAQLRSSFTYVPVFYPNAHEITAAQAVMVVAGGLRQGVDLTMSKASVVRVRGKLTGAPAPAGAVGFPQRPTLTLRTRNSPLVFGQGEMPVAPNAKGEFVFENVASGSYVLSASTYGPLEQRLVARVNVEVGNRDVTELTLQLEPVMTLAGHLRVENDAEFLRTNLMLQPLDANPRGGAFTTADKEGKFTFQVEREKYGVRVMNLPEGYFVRSISMGRQDATETLDLTSGPDGDLVVTLEKGTAEITGQVMGKDKKPAVGAQVMVLNSKLEPVSQAITLAEGRYRVAEIPPGDYRLVAVAATEASDLDLIEQLASSSDKIVLTPSARETRQLELR
jgi:hypothetical protein